MAASGGPLWLAALAAVALAASVGAQTPAQQARLDQLARYTLASPVCVHMGMERIGGGEQLDAAVKAEALQLGMTPEAYSKASRSTMTRHLRNFEIDSTAFADKNTKTEAGLRNVRAFYLRYGPSCIEASQDPLFSKFLKSPPEFDLQKAAIRAADSLLEGGGLASWQTAEIQARGDLMLAAGACRRHIGPDRADRIYESYAHVPDPRERSYYVSSYDEGLQDAELDFDAVQCERLIKNLKKKAGASTRGERG